MRSQRLTSSTTLNKILYVPPQTEQQQKKLFCKMRLSIIKNVKFSNFILVQCMFLLLFQHLHVSWSPLLYLFTTKTVFVHLISKLILLSSVVQDGAIRDTEQKEVGMYYWTRGWLTKLTNVKAQPSRMQLIFLSILQVWASMSQCIYRAIRCSL